MGDENHKIGPVFIRCGVKGVRSQAAGLINDWVDAGALFEMGATREWGRKVRGADWGVGGKCSTSNV